MRRREIIRWLHLLDLKPKKSKGQNFLLSDRVLHRITEALELCPSDTVVEIGAGFGFLTALIAQKVARVYAFEVEPKFHRFWNARLSHFKNITWLMQDFLSYPLSQFPEKSWKLAGNIPYSLTTLILERMVVHRNRIPLSVLMVQKEVAQRITAKEGGRIFGRLSIFLQSFFEVRKVLFVPPTAFYPSPDVHSAVVQFRLREKPLIESPDYELFVRIVKEGFAERRKTIFHNLSRWLGKERAGLLLEKTQIPPKARAEKLPLSSWNRLALFLPESLLGGQGIKNSDKKAENRI